MLATIPFGDEDRLGRSGGAHSRERCSHPLDVAAEGSLCLHRLDELAHGGMDRARTSSKLLDAGEVDSLRRDDELERAHEAQPLE